MGGPDLRQLEYFIEVANTLNITHAAIRHMCHSRRSAVRFVFSKRSSEPNFFKRRSGVALTEAGQRLAIGRARC